MLPCAWRLCNSLFASSCSLSDTEHSKRRSFKKLNLSPTSGLWLTALKVVNTKRKNPHIWSWGVSRVRTSLFQATLPQLSFISADYCRKTYSSPAADRLLKLSKAYLQLKHSNLVQLFENKQSVLSLKRYLGYIFETSHNKTSGLCENCHSVATICVTHTKQVDRTKLDLGGLCSPPPSRRYAGITVCLCNSIQRQ